MKSMVQSIKQINVDGRWIIIIYSYFILFHLFPTFIVGVNPGRLAYTFMRAYQLGGSIGLIPALMFLIICAMIVYRFNRGLIAEIFAASLLYAITLIVFAVKHGVISFDKVQYSIRLTIQKGAFVFSVMTAVVMILALVGILIGYWLKLRKERRTFRPSEGYTESP
ncbi:MAG: hypothetical protein V1799_13145 [bacterium]